MASESRSSEPQEHSHSCQASKQSCGQVTGCWGPRRWEAAREQAACYLNTHHLCMKFQASAMKNKTHQLRPQKVKRSLRKVSGIEHVPTKPLWGIFVFFSFFKFFKFYLLIYLLAVLGLRFCARAPPSRGKRRPLFIAVCGPLTIVASLVAEHRLQTRRLSNCGSRA